MNPVFVTVGPLRIYSFGVMVALGLLLALSLMERDSSRSGFPKKGQSFDLVFWAMVGGFLGARILYVIQHYDLYRRDFWGIFAFWQGGLIFYGGIFGILAVLPLFARVKHLSVLQCLDFLVPYGALTQAFGRMGCFLNGCCMGKICGLPWAVTFPGELAARHPAQIYSALFNLALFFFLRHRHEIPHSRGSVMFLYLMFYGAGRFILEFFRAGNPQAGFLTYNQWISLMLVVAGLIFYSLMKSRKTNTAPRGYA